MVDRIKACLNGGRGRDDHPSVPISPAELAVAAVAAVAAGAEALHLHPRDRDGTESLHASDIAAAVTAVRQACARTPIGVSTGLWITNGDPSARRAAVRRWAELPGYARPDFASVNLSEPAPADLIALLGTAGIGIEAGVWSIADARAATALRPAAGWLRILVELLHVPAASPIAPSDAIASDGANATSGAIVASGANAANGAIASSGAVAANGAVASSGAVAANGANATSGAVDGSSAIAIADDILRQLDASAVIGPRLLHGEGAECWPLIAHAGQLGLPTRIGLEDTTVGPDGSPVADNAELVRLALATWTTSASSRHQLS